MKSDGHVASMGKMLNAYRILIKYLKGRDDLGDLGVNMRNRS
jgi:hypothetical protein